MRSSEDLEETRAYVRSVAMKYVRNETDAEESVPSLPVFVESSDVDWEEQPVNWQTARKQSAASEKRIL